ARARPAAPSGDVPAAGLARAGAPIAPPAGWSVRADVVVVGSGVAGLTVALRCAAAGLRPVIVTKALMDEGSTRWAQGGIAAALGADDSPADHERDTLVAGAGLCDPDAVRLLVTEGPAAVRRLIGAGARFDLDGSGAIALTREGGHHRRRIAHAGGDATGAEISRALADAVRAAGIETIEHALVLDLLTDPADPTGATAGVSLHVMGEGRHDGVGAVLAPAVVLATGGMGQIFSVTTNPTVSTGDGVALALRAGAEVADAEFVQFHPTVLYLGPEARGRQPLISEAVRGEGGLLLDASGRRFMVGVHELAELAPRDVVAKAITRTTREQGTPYVHLDARHFGAEMWERRFPTILAACREHGIDPVTEPIPVSPAAHYASGGVRTDLWGRTTVPGLYACGEVACTGVHGGNRLASNSLLEGLVFAERIADAVLAARSGAAPAERAGVPADRLSVGGPGGGPGPLLAPDARPEIQRIMTDHAGVLRSAEGLRTAAGELDALAARAAEKPAEPGTDSWETTNLHLVARVLVAAATERAETRGCHWREDHPEADDARRRHLVLALRPAAPDGSGASLRLWATDSVSLPPTVEPPGEN
ncbi:L-aspartate oxidase, partial [Streptomyces alkaliphilus]|uniref:L-aspartate oxidase n=1 Tax=Streptomyces alkaliphilus TaxID=1472722 RepID=UPI0018872253